MRHVGIRFIIGTNLISRGARIGKTKPTCFAHSQLKRLAADEIILAFIVFTKALRPANNTIINSFCYHGST